MMPYSQEGMMSEIQKKLLKEIQDRNKRALSIHSSWNDLSDAQKDRHTLLMWLDKYLKEGEW